MKKRYHKTGKYGNTRLDGILAYLFLKAVNLMVSDEQVAKATTKNFRHKTVKSKFINIFPDILYVPNLNSMTYILNPKRNTTYKMIH